VRPVEHDHPGAGPEDRSPVAPDRLVQPVQAGEPHDRRRLATRDDEPVEPVELRRQPDLDHVRSEPAQHLRVLAKRPLERQHPDPKPPFHVSQSRFV
jgi:hypothetical protein